MKLRQRTVRGRFNGAAVSAAFIIPVNRHFAALHYPDSFPTPSNNPNPYARVSIRYRLALRLIGDWMRLERGEDRFIFSRPSGKS